MNVSFRLPATLFGTTTTNIPCNVYRNKSVSRKAKINCVVQEYVPIGYTFCTTCDRPPNDIQKNQPINNA